jgi:hypothetical protein
MRGDHNQSTEITQMSDAKGAELTARRACRIAVLPGSACGPDPVLPQRQPLPVVAPTHGTQQKLQDWTAQSRSLAPPRAPPRMI